MPTAVVAIGGNSLITDPEHVSVEDQYAAVDETAEHLVELTRAGWDIVVVHGNGPQVGFILRRSELAAHELHEIPLDVCGADTQGAIGYALQQSLQNRYARLGIEREVATLVTQVEVDPADPAFDHPSKPIGSFMTPQKAEERRAQGWDVLEDAGRGWRRVVPSPQPMRIVEESTIRLLVEAGVTVVAVGGGGIPVMTDDEGDLIGLAAVIDKDNAASLLARNLGADLLLISTAVPKVLLNYGSPEQRPVDEMIRSEAEAYLEEGVHFAEGSMAPKIRAGVAFLAAGGSEVIITDPPNIVAAVDGRAGTRILP